MTPSQRLRSLPAGRAVFLQLHGEVEHTLQLVMAEIEHGQKVLRLNRHARPIRRSNRMTT